MVENPQDITYIGETDFRNARKKFGIKNTDRFRHIYIIGKTGTGKTTLIENMIAQDIIRGNGVAFLDPHGSSAEKMLDYVPEHRVKDVIYFAPFDMNYPISFNVLEDAGGPDERHKVANGILSVMKTIWVDAFSGRMEYLVQNVLLALLEYPNATLLGFNRMLTDKEYRKLIVDNVKDPSVRSFWIDDYGKWDDKYRREAGAAIQNKIGQFTSNPIIRNIIAQPKSSFNLQEIMDNQKIFIGNLSKGLLGEQNAQLLGGMLSTKIYLAAMSRAKHPEEYIEKKLPGFYLYADEFQNFANESFASVLSEARKYKLSLTMAHQYVTQLVETVRDAVIGNVGTMIVFRIGPQDAELFEREFAPEFVQQDMVGLAFAQVYMRLSIDGMTSRAFSARTLPPIAKPAISMKERVFLSSREIYARPRAEVEIEIEEWFKPIPSQKQLDHQEYLKQKRAEVEATGGVWVEEEADKLYPAPVEDEEDHRGYNKKSFYKSQSQLPRYGDRDRPSGSAQSRPYSPRQRYTPPIENAPQKPSKIIVSPELQGLINTLDSSTKEEKIKAVKKDSFPEEKKIKDSISLDDMGSNTNTAISTKWQKEKEAREKEKEKRLIEKTAKPESTSALKDILNRIKIATPPSPDKSTTPHTSRATEQQAQQSVQQPTSQKTVASSNLLEYTSPTATTVHSDIVPSQHTLSNPGTTQNEVDTDVLRQVLE